jgi:hypothetical protein
MKRIEIMIKKAKMKGCMICGNELIHNTYSEKLRCSYCNKEEESLMSCVNGHYVCNECHSKDALEIIEKICMESALTDPIALAAHIFNLNILPMHGPEHHSLVPAILVTAYGNIMNNKSEKAIREAIKRGRNIIGGMCGYYGACGAAIGTGIAYSVINNVTPLSKEKWGQANIMTSLALQELGNIGGPRCCKRDSIKSIETAMKNFEAFNNISRNQFICNQFSKNKECLHNECPYFPNK